VAVVIVAATVVATVRPDPVTRCRAQYTILPAEGRYDTVLQCGDEPPTVGLHPQRFFRFFLSFGQVRHGIEILFAV
jgi:hypothetical protein